MFIIITLQTLHVIYAVHSSRTRKDLLAVFCVVVTAINIASDRSSSVLTLRTQDLSHYQHLDANSARVLSTPPKQPLPLGFNKKC